MAVSLPEPLDFGWPWRLVEETEHSIVQLGDGRVEIRIWHDMLTGITVDMLEWWFQHLDGTGTFAGMTLPLYRLWHPRDHIAIRATRDDEGRVAPGCKIHIQEAFGRDLANLVDESPGLHRWDRNGIGLHVNRAGHRVMELDHVWRQRPEGVIYESCMRIGASAGPLSGIIDAWYLPQRFGPATTQAWLKHNIEEVGCFVHFLPELFRTHALDAHAR